MLLITLAAVAALAYFAGSGIERAREAHTNFRSYKRRVASMRGVRLKETTRAVISVVALLVLLDVVAHIV